MKVHIILLMVSGIITLLTSCQAQPATDKANQQKAPAQTQQPVGGGCEGCELMYVAMPNEITPEHRSIGWTEGTQKLMVTGRVFQRDGKTPAPGIIIYYWHTDENGLYSSNSQTPANARQHGKNRGWVKSDKDGNYTMKTVRPGAYPNDVIPQHIHLSIKEPDIPQEYYADLYFEDDPLYAGHVKKYGKIDRAGNELLRVRREGGVLIADHAVILGLNIPNYPVK
jgi:protocatechuate 3,4-dioxygenase, beta subunit